MKNLKSLNIDKSLLLKMFLSRYPCLNESDFERYFEEYQNIKPFKASENIFESGQTISDEAHYIMRLILSFKIAEALEVMKIDLSDPNIGEDFNVGNVGTPGRIAKCWVGADTNDDSEIGSGRFMKPIRIASFPNNNAYSKIPITKRVNISANCSHHFLPFNTAFDENSYAIISYVPKENVLGISKLQRLADYVSRRFWLQEDLTKELYRKISEAAQTKDVYVGLFNIKHTCEWLRGAKNAEGGFTSEYYSGVFDDAELRKQVKRT